MTNLDNILKSRDIILPTQVHPVKAMVFPVAMYGYECWTIKKLCVRDSKRDTDVQISLMDSVGEGEGWEIWENDMDI